MIEAEVLVESKNWKKIIQNPKKKIRNILNKFPNNYKYLLKKGFVIFAMVSLMLVTE